MPEKGWHSLTVREMAETRGLTVDQLIRELLIADLKDAWVTCNLCGAKIKAENMPKHMTKVHPRRT